MVVRLSRVRENQSRFENFVVDTINAKIDPSWWLNPSSSRGDKHLNSPYSKTKKDNQTEQTFLTVKQINSPH